MNNEYEIKKKLVEENNSENWIQVYKNKWNLLTPEEKEIEYLSLLDKLNIRTAILVDSKWISKYERISSKLYLLSNDLIKEHKYLQLENETLKNELERGKE